MKLLLTFFLFLLAHDGGLCHQTKLVITGNTRINSFRQAKKLATQIYTRHSWTFYCDCPFIGTKIQLNRCSYEPLRYNDRAQRLEWEHVVPAYKFGKNFKAWKTGHKLCTRKSTSKRTTYKGRRCARKASMQFRKMEADLFNLVPAIGEVNGARLNYPMAIIPGEVRMFGECNLEISDQKIEPRPSIRGDIARIYFYMANAYPKKVQLNDRELRLFKNWNQQDPVDRWEGLRARRITRIQGNQNPFITEKKAFIEQLITKL